MSADCPGGVSSPLHPPASASTLRCSRTESSICADPPIHDSGAKSVPVSFRKSTDVENWTGARIILLDDANGVVEAKATARPPAWGVRQSSRYQGAFIRRTLAKL